MHELNLRAFHKKETPEIMEMATNYWREGDITGVLCMMSNERSMAFVADNWFLLKKFGKYEEALLHAYHSIRTNYSN